MTVLPERVEKSLNALRSTKPPATFPSSGICLQELTFSVPGPVDRTYTVVNQRIPRELFCEQLEDPVAHEESTHACPIATMELFHGEDRMNILISLTFNRLRIAYPGLRPWEFGQKITDTNLNIFSEENFLIMGCHQPYWPKGYDRKLTKTNVHPNLRMYCRKHQRIEVQKVKIQPLSQLAAGMFNFEDWTFFVSKLFDKTTFASH